jgi:hypothetical protein
MTLRKWFSLVVAVLSAVCLLSGMAFAEESAEQAATPTEDTVEQAVTPKHEGIHLRMAVGPGFSYFSTSYADNNFSIMGATIIPELHLGFSPIENLEVTGGLSGSILVEPNLDADQAGVSASSGSGLVAVNAGLAVTYFFMPYNIFLGGHVDISYATFKIDSTVVGNDAYTAIGRHRLGFATGMQFGKEWWVSDKAGLGLALQYIFYLYPRTFSGAQQATFGTDSIMWLGHTAGLTMTATYN